MINYFYVPAWTAWCYFNFNAMTSKAAHLQTALGYEMWLWGSIALVLFCTITYAITACTRRRMVIPVVGQLIISVTPLILTVGVGGEVGGGGGQLEGVGESEQLEGVGESEQLEGVGAVGAGRVKKEVKARGRGSKGKWVLTPPPPPTAPTPSNCSNRPPPPPTAQTIPTPSNCSDSPTNCPHPLQLPPPPPTAPTPSNCPHPLQLL